MKRFALALVMAGLVVGLCHAEDDPTLPRAFRGAILGASVAELRETLPGLPEPDRAGSRITSPPGRLVIHFWDGEAMAISFIVGRPAPDGWGLAQYVAEFMGDMSPYAAWDEGVRPPDRFLLAGHAWQDGDTRVIACVTETAFWINLTDRRRWALMQARSAPAGRSR